MSELGLLRAIYTDPYPGTLLVQVNYALDAGSSAGLRSSFGEISPQQLAANEAKAKRQAKKAAKSEAAAAAAAAAVVVVDETTASW